MYRILVQNTQRNLASASSKGPRTGAAPWAVWLILPLSVGSSSCFFKKTPRAFVPPPVPPHTQVARDLPPLPEPPAIEIATIAVPVDLDLSSSIAPLPAPAARQRRLTPSPAKPQTPPVTALAPEPLPAPRLGQIFTPDQLREYTRQLDDSLDRVRKALAVVAEKNLSADQADIADRIRTFQKQAEQAREEDLVTAVNLARRADLLAKDLLGRLP